MNQPELPQMSPNPPEQDETERQEWLEKLRLHLQDPEFRQSPGFPIASDEAILALSDPPYYTACPNPFLAEILAGWQASRPAEAVEAEQTYHRDPFAADVSEGKNDPIYNAHSYHTKVPHKAIMRYILHYTNPSDVVLDGFCGTGMTGVAAQLCGDKKSVESLGYRVARDGTVFDGDQPISKLGPRRAVLVDLSPAATFIAYNYNTPVDARQFAHAAQRILAEVEQECGWMYLTRHDATAQGKINYTVWSDVFLCPACNTEMVFWDVAVDHEKGAVRDAWHCPGCQALLSKSPRKDSRAQRAERAFETRFDRALGHTVRQARQVPVLINYSVGKTRHEKHPDADDLALLQKIEDREVPLPFPTDRMLEGDESRRNDDIGLTHVHHFYTRRNLWILAMLWRKIALVTDFRIRSSMKFLWQSLALGYTRLNRYGATHFSQVNRILSGTLYISSLMSEVSADYAFRGKIKRLSNALGNKSIPTKSFPPPLVTTNSSSIVNLPQKSIDYIFIDPPFGANLMYSELNFLWEAWLGVFTNNISEAVVNKVQRKGLPEYQALMEDCFREFYRLLKPGRWMTVEFHNSQNAVWNSILEGILRAGFMIADVRTLDKQQGTFKQVTTTAAVKQDLIISAYKPAAEFERRFASEQGSPAGAWEFVRQHLEYLAPPSLQPNGTLTFIEERAPYLLYDRMVAYHIQRGLTVPLSAPEFYAGLKERFAERDGMTFTFPQAAEFDRLRLQAERVEQLPLFIIDEKSAIRWLRRQLDPGQGGEPKTYADLSNPFKSASHLVPYEALPELRELLEQNFLKDETTQEYRIPDASKDSDLQEMREKSLLREFALYRQGKGRLKTFRLEAIRAGFSRLWKERDYATIVQVAGRLPERVFEDDPQLMMYADNARLRAEAAPRQERLL